MTDSSHTMVREVNHHLSEHEVMISFESDEGAYAFRQWWIEEGEVAYTAFAEEFGE